ncbi:DUF3148 family protein [Arachis hypogaea]|nr:DUF3148 family protein [Arachis hypogaea]
MALPYSFATTTKSSVFSKLHNTSFFQHNQLQRANVVTVVNRESKDSSEDNIELQAKGPKLEIGSPIIFTEAPKMIKTTASVLCLRVNSGLVKPGDVGRYFKLFHSSLLLLAINFLFLFFISMNCPDKL